MFIERTNLNILAELETIKLFSGDLKNFLVTYKMNMVKLSLKEAS
jgi:hypothetical protein